MFTCYPVTRASTRYRLKYIFKHYTDYFSMDQQLKETLHQLAQDESSAKKLEELFSDLKNERDQAQTHLELLENAIRSDYDSIIITTLELDKPGPQIVYANKGFERMTGYSREEVLGKTPRILQGEKTDRSVLDKLRKRLKEGQAFFGHTVNYKKDGTEFINQWDIHPLTNAEGEITHWVSYQHDITERKRSEEKLFDTNVEFDQLKEESKKTLVDADEQGNILTSNKAFRDLTGFDNEELKSLKIWDLLQDKYIASFRHKFDKFKPSDFDDRTYEFQIKTKRGLPVEVKADTRLLNNHGQTIVRITFENKSLQKRIAKILQEKNSKYADIFHKAVDFNYKIIESDDTYHFDHVTKSFSKLTGIDLNEALKLSLKNFIHEMDWKKAEKHFKKVFEGTPDTEKFRLKTRSGKYINVIDYAKPEWDADHTSVVSIKGAASKESLSESEKQS